MNSDNEVKNHTEITLFSRMMISLLNKLH